MGHVIASAIYDGLLAFEYSIAREILGRDRRDLVADWYDFRTCRVERGRLFSSHGLQIRPTGTLEDLAAADTILIAGWRDPLERPPEPLLEALEYAHSRGARLVSICTGAFPLAHAGLLDGRAATTHWLHVDTLRTAFPRIRVEEDALYLHDPSGPGQISTSAGCAAGLDLCLAIVREDFGLTIANTIARKFGFSLRTFQRRFKEISGLSPHQWLVQQRVAKARELLESSDRSVEQIATHSGLGSAANLRKHLVRHLGTTPRAYRSAFRAVS